jgi:alkanesulfonate monooxygenase SsuD/methylene tetrahydromethanopterin reductase-like flavin-dependent oxidoreductase (luciferase family)
MAAGPPVTAKRRRTCSRAELALITSEWHVDAVVFTEPELGSSYEQLATAAQLAERLGWYGFFCADHYISPTQRPKPPGPVDAWTTLARLARETSAKGWAR